MTPIARAVVLALATLGFFGVQAFPDERFRAQDIPKQEDRWRERDWERGDSARETGCNEPHRGCERDCNKQTQFCQCGCGRLEMGDERGCDEHGRDMRMERGRDAAQEGGNEVAPHREKAGLNIGQFVLYAERSLSLGDFSRVCRGDLGVRSFGNAPAGSQLKIGSDIFIQPNHRLFAPSVLVGRNVTLGAVQTNQLIDDGIRLGTATSFPVTAMPTLPLAAAAAGGGPDIFVETDQVLALPSGNYGTVRVDGFLMLNPGLYSVVKLEVGDFGRVIAIAGDVRMTVVNTLTAGRHTEIHPALGLPAEHLRISVAGSDVKGQPAASIGEHSRVRALVSAPHGTLAFADDVRATGAFAAFDVAIGASARVAFQNGFPADTPGDRGSQLLSGYFATSPEPSVAPFLEPVPNDTNIHLAISLPVRDPAGLKTFIQQVSDPKSPNYRKYLTQDQFYATYGATASDYQALQDWARSASGFTIAATYPNNLLLSVTGTAAQIERALHVNLVFRQRTDDSAFVAVDREPSIDLAVPILQISGLTDYVLPKSLDVHGTGGAGGGGTAFAGTSYRAADLRNAYLGVGSNCQSLDGTGQVIGIVGFDVFAKSDIDGYDSAQLPPITNHASVALTALGQQFGPPGGFFREATLDVEMAQAMAPGATILFFMEAPECCTFMHIDEAFNAMATSTPALTVASSSLEFHPDDTQQQAIDEMAAQGVSFFQGSGDFGDIGDPQRNERMNHQTLVGGTLLSTNPLIAGLPNPVYPNNYYAGETAWTRGLPAKSKDASGGGIMDGHSKKNSCLFCGGPVTIPDYQAGVSMATNGGSTTFRNYPDVAMAADNVEIFFKGSTTVDGGTSAAAPLWAGFTALVNQRSAQNGAGLMGFLNPTLYAIGLTRGSPTDLYSNSFNDITSGNNADGFGSGFNAVSGYDLVTGWGSPTCQLVNQLATVTPLDPNTPLSLIRFTVVTGNDDAGGGFNGSSQTADVLLQDGSSFTVTLRLSNEPHWDNGSTHDITFPIPDTVNPPLTQSHGIAGVRINLIQNNDDCCADNWDIADLFVNLLNPGSPQVCQLFLVGTSRLQDGSTGLVRLSKNPGHSGVGPHAEFPMGAATGCVGP